MAMNAADIPSAVRRCEEALALCRQLGNASGAAYAQFMLGNALAAEGDLARARRLYEESVKVFRALDEQHFALLASRHLAFGYERLGDRERARALHEENLREARTTHNARIEATALGALADYAVDDGRIADARDLLTLSLRLHRELRDLLDTAVDLSRYARVLAHAGEPENAVRLVSSLDGVAGDIGARGGQVARTNDETLALARTQLDDDAFARAQDEGAALTLEEALALSLEETG
jgi:ATP/maltotriose-dependent transcriptional regulator MalT